MKQIIQQLLSCLILSVIFCSTAWGQSEPALGTHVSQTYSDGSFNISNTNFNSSAKSIKVFFDFGEGNIDWIAIAYDRWNAQNDDKKFLKQNNLSNRYHTIIVTNSDIISEMSSTSGISVSYGNTTRSIKVIITNYNTADGAANDKSEASGIDPNAGSSPGTGTVTPPSNKPLADKIRDHEQLTNIPTIYLTVPDALNADGTAKEINSVLNKDNGVAEYHTASILVVDNSGTISFTDDKLEIKVRGNSTAQEPGKKPYRLKFGKETLPDGTVVSHKHDMLGPDFKTGAKRNWTLLTNHKDASLLHNALTYHVGKAVGMDFCPGYKFVDLVINGEYRGNYQISDHVEVGKNRIEVNEDTGWYVETNGQAIMAEEPKTTGAGIALSIKNPEPAPGEETAKLKDDVKKYFDDLNYYWGVYHNNPCSFEDFINPKTGWRAYIDEESLVKFYVGINLTDDYDGFMTVKTYREADGKLKFGPLWDKDLAYGNWQNHGKLAEEYQNGYTFSDHIQRMMTDPYFVKKVYEKLHAVVDAGFIENMQEKIYAMEKEITASQALNQSKWYACDNYPAAVKEFADYIEEHTNYVVGRIDEKYNAIDWSTVPTFPDTPDDDDDTPVGDLGALVDLGNGKYSYTGSASTFKEGTEITITTSTAGTTLSNYITEGTQWNTTKTITLTAADVDLLRASENKYTFFMQATGGEVKAVNVTEPVQVATGLSEGEECTYNENKGILYTYVGDSKCMAEGAKFNITLEGNTPYYTTYTSSNSQLWFEWGTGVKDYSYTITEAQATALKNNGYKLNIVVYNGTISKASFVAQTSGSGTKTHTLTLNATEGGTVTGAGEYAEGTTVLIKAIPNEGYKFVKWSDDNTYASRSVTLNEAVTLTAIFAAEGSADEDPFNEQGTRKQLTDLPTIYLDATTINGEWLEAAVEVFDKDNKLYQGANWSKAGVSKKGNINVSVQYQGSGADNSKNSYRLKFNDKINLLSATGLYKQWVLLANDDDPTMLNNALAKELGDAIGMPWTPGYQFVDLYVNDKYMGTYQLTDRVKAEEGRSLVTGGNKDLDWQVRFNDDTERQEDGTEDFIAASQASGVNVIYRNPDPKDYTTDEQKATFNGILSAMETYFNNFFAETATNTFGNIPANVDKQQLINWYIAQEILGVYKGFSSIEAYRSVTEAAADNLLHFGPLWDSEKGFGNTGLAPKNIATEMGDLNTSGSYKGLMIEYSAFPKMNKIFQYLWTQDWFKSGVKTKWDAIKTSLPTTLSGTITTLKGTISASQTLNAKKWNSSLGSFQTYDAALAATNTFITNRFAYLDKKFTELAGAAHVHSYTAYIDNGDGTHSRKCPTDNEVEDGSEIHTLIVNANGKAACSVCHLEIEGTSNMGTTDEKVYILDAETSKVQYISKSTGFTPAPNNVYKINEKPDAGTEFVNVYWVSADGKTNYADKIVVDDSAPWNVKVQIMAKEATHTRSTAAASIWGTVCLPFKTLSNEDVTLFKLSSVSVDEDGKGTMVFTEASSRGALTPLVFKKNNSSATSVTFTSEAQTDNADPAKNGFVTVKPTEKMSKNKSASKDPLPTGWEYYGNVQEKQTVTANADGNPALYFISSNKFYRATSTLKVSPFRAYFEYTAPAAEAKIATFSIADEEATKIVSTLNEKNSLAIFTTTGGVNIVAPKDMTVNIYTTAGTLAKRIAATANESQFVALPCGMYVINGAKFVIK